MRIKSITVGYGLTYSLENYNNVKPSITITAERDDGESLQDITAALYCQARQHVHDAVDEALEAEGHSPRFYQGPLYTLYHWRQRDANVILPADVKTDDLPGTWDRFYKCQRQRIITVSDYACRERDRKSTPIISLPNGILDEIYIWWKRHTWYRPYPLYTVPHEWSKDFGQILIVSQDLPKPDRLAVSRNFNNRDRQLPDIIADFNADEAFRDLWFIVHDINTPMPEIDDVPKDRILLVDGSQGLAAYVEQWYAEHPESGADPDPVDDEDEDDDGKKKRRSHTKNRKPGQQADPAPGHIMG